MSDEFETAGMASAGGLKSDKANRQQTDICRNCGARTPEKYCSSCGQLATNFHRPVWSLVGAGLADFFALDGRIARTIPALLFRPGHVTRAYLDGQRARFVPPFRLFLLSSLLFFSIVFALGDQMGWTKSMYLVPNDNGGWNMQLGDRRDVGEDRPDFMREDGTIDREILKQRLSDSDEAESTEELNQVVDRIVTTYENQQQFFSEVEDWLPRISLLLLPVLVAVLTLVFAWRRSVYVYDHMITALHFQSWIYLLGALLLVLSYFVTPWFSLGFVFGPPLYIYKLMRKVYSSGRILAFFRMSIVVLASFVSLTTLLISVIVISAMATGS